MNNLTGERQSVPPSASQSRDARRAASYDQRSAATRPSSDHGTPCTPRCAARSHTRPQACAHAGSAASHGSEMFERFQRDAARAARSDAGSHRSEQHSRRDQRLSTHRIDEDAESVWEVESGVSMSTMGRANKHRQPELSKAYEAAAAAERAAAAAVMKTADPLYDFDEDEDEFDGGLAGV